MSNNTNHNNSFNTIQYDIDLKQDVKLYTTIRRFNTIQYDIDLKRPCTTRVPTLVLIPFNMT